MKARGGRWRTATRLARREMRRRPWRTALTALLIAVPVAAMVVAEVDYRTDRLGPDPAMTFGTADALLMVDPGMNDHRAEIEGQFPPGTDWTWSPFADVPLRSTANPDELVNAYVVVRDMSNSLNDGTVRDLDGRLPNAPDEVVLDPELADRFAADIGDQLTLVRPAQSFTVVGIGEVGGLYISSSMSILAPGFDLAALRPEAISYEVRLTHPSLAAQVSAIGAMSPLPAPPAPPFPMIMVSIDADPQTGETFQIQPSLILRGSDQPQPEPGVLVLGWLFGALLMGVLGLVVAAAFAVSGRRQLVTIGQLSGTGADPVLLRRFLALQGTWTGLVGASIGVAGGLAIVCGFDRLIRNDGRIAWHPVDWMVIAATALVVATAAAIVPTRSMADMSVLSALGGRRPVRAVRRRQLPTGLASLSGGLAGLFLAVVAARDSNRETVVPAIFAMLGAVAVLVGVCCLCPVVVDWIARLGARRTGVAMLATRSLGRHRARAAALLAAIVAVGSAGTAIAAAGDQEVKNERAMNESLIRWSPDVIALFAFGFDESTQTDVRVDPEQSEPGVRAEVERVVGDVSWVRAATIGTDVRFGDVYVADDELLASMGMSSAQRAEVAQLDVFSLVSSDADSYGWSTYGLGGVGPNLTLPEPSTVMIPDLAFNYFTHLVTPDYVERRGWQRQPPVWFGRADHPLTRSEADAVFAIAGDTEQEYVFADFDRETATVKIQTDCNCGATNLVGWLRLATIGGTLLLMTLIVALGMALWAAEGRDERDTLVAIGASPSVLARIAATKAWTLAMVGTLMAVPLGFGTLRLAMSAAREPTMFPWFFALAALVGFPLAIAAGAWAASALGQRLRPITASNATAD